ncbi:MAG: type II toxin-antitoxin system PemK/MazF family toxin [Anaerolineales bacterium]|nr:type II toxin-antitoxin system PemK/MazF family toxin [Anaerolineales bacterium]
MVTPTTRAVVLVTFPFSDLSRSKLRPAIVLAFAGRDDWILSQITSKSYGDAQAVTIDDDSLVEGSPRVISYARPGKLFTVNSSIIKSQVGTLGEESFKVIIDAVIKVLRSGVS